MPSNKSFPAILHVLNNVNRIQHAPVKGFPYNYVFHPIYQARMFIQTMLNRMKLPALFRFFNEGNRPDLYQPNAFVLQPRLRMKGFILFFTLTIWIGIAFSIPVTCLYSLVTLVIRKIQPHTLCTVPELPSQ